MPLTSLYLLSLTTSTSLPAFLKSLYSSLAAVSNPIIVARPLRWIIPPWHDSRTASDTSAIASLQATNWDLLLIFPREVALPPACASLVAQQLHLLVGVPSRLLSAFAPTNRALLHPSPSSIPPLTGSLAPGRPLTADSAKDLELTGEVLAWATTPAQATASDTPRPLGAVSMLNFLAFVATQEAKASYQRYGAEFARRVGSRRGGNAKIVGTVVEKGREIRQQQLWDEVALAHYPSAAHFADMVASEDYQEVNEAHRKRALRGTGILCCDELVLEGLVMEAKSPVGKGARL